MEDPEKNTKVKNFLVYKYTFPNDKSYVGVTIRTEPQRTAQHVYEAKNDGDVGSHALNAAIRKYGEKSFKREIIFRGSGTHEEMDIKEMELIAEHKTLVPNGYNIKPGGHTIPQTAEMIQKRSKSLRKKPEGVGLPMHTKAELKRGKLVWRINNHPKCSNKNFKTKEEMLTFLADLESGKIEPIIAKPRTKKINPPEKYIHVRENGYVVEYRGTHLASFLDKHGDKEKLLEKAREFLKKYLSEHQT